MEGLESSNEQNALDLVLADLASHGLKLASREGSLCAQEGAPHGCPPVDRLPGHALDVAVHQTLDTIVNAKRVVTYKMITN